MHDSQPRSAGPYQRTIIPTYTDIDRGSCGIGFVADRHGRPSHELLQLGLQSLINLQHRGALNADGLTGDGAGILTSLPKRFFAREAEKLAGQTVDADFLAVATLFLYPDVLDDCRFIFEAALAAYVASCSSRTIVYKGLVLAPQLSAFYADLRDPLFAPHLVLFHQRYSTNTLPTWHRAQPFRVLCHNGEINTIQGNIAWMAAREAELQLNWPGFHLRADDLVPVIDLDGSDSAMLDNAAELLLRGGRDIRHVLSMVIPAAWEKSPDLPESVRDFYRYHAALSEPWDGPAAIVFSDGRIVGAALDRNGLRPLRYIVCDDGLIGAASEVGAINIPASHILVKERLGPGQMFAVDTATGDLFDDHNLKALLAAGQPYGDWLRDNLQSLTNRTFPLYSQHLTR